MTRQNVWTKGALARDNIHACRTPKLVIPVTAPTGLKAKAIKKAIWKRKLEQLKKEREEEASRKEEEKTNDSEQTKYDEKIAELGKQLENFQKEKHKVFLSLKQVLQAEKSKQQAIALKKSQQEAKQLEETIKFESEKTHSRRITSPGPASRMYIPQPQMLVRNMPSVQASPWNSSSILPPPVFFPRTSGRPSHIHQPFPPAPQMIRPPAMPLPHHNHIVPRNPMRRADSRRGRDRWNGW